MVSVKQFMNKHNGGFVLVAAEDIPGFYKKGDHMYGDCGDMIVVESLYQPLNGIYTLFCK